MITLEFLVEDGVSIKSVDDLENYYRILSQMIAQSKQKTFVKIINTIPEEYEDEYKDVYLKWIRIQASEEMFKNIKERLEKYGVTFHNVWKDKYRYGRYEIKVQN